jgi:DNA-binding response OmpR family regulator
MAERQTHIAGSEPGQGELDGRAAQVLLAEDDAEVRRLLIQALRRDGYDVIAVSTGEEMLGALRASERAVPPRAPPDLILSDIRMPGLSGLETLAILKQGERSPPVILITAFGDAETHAEAARLGAKFVFDKPFDLAHLRAAVASVIRRGGKDRSPAPPARARSAALESMNSSTRRTV